MSRARRAGYLAAWGLCSLIGLRGAAIAVSPDAMSPESAIGRPAVEKELFPAHDTSGAKLGTLVVTSIARSGSSHERPTIFIFNGGPGAASGWLQLGLFGPYRIALADDPSRPLAASLDLVADDDRLSDAADLVFVDPLGTGFSRVDQGVADARVFDWRQDAAYLSNFIREWLGRHHRQGSPVILVGESYGTERVTAIADDLSASADPVDLGAVVLISQSVTVENTRQRPENDLGTAVGLPTIAAIACDLGLSKTMGGRPMQCAESAQDFAWNTYLPALVAGTDLPSDRRRDMIHSLSAITGLDEALIERHGIAITKDEYRLLALQRSNRILGVYDARYSAPFDHRPSQDPFMDSLLPRMQNAIVRYNERVGTFGSSPVDGTPYRMLDPTIEERWQYGARQDIYSGPNMMEVLARAVRRSNALLFIAGGLFDTAGSYGADRYLASHLRIPRSQMMLRSFDGGHMFYLDSTSRTEFARNLKDLIRSTAGRSR